MYSGGKLNDDMLIVTICEMFGWTYQEYQDQPSFFLQLIIKKMVIDNKEKEMQYRKIKHG
ncbi:MAG: hypothetical protein DU489_07045 [Nitrosomonas sp.]